MYPANSAMRHCPTLVPIAQNVFSGGEKEGFPQCCPPSVILLHTRFFWNPALTLLSHTLSLCLSAPQVAYCQNTKKTSLPPTKGIHSQPYYIVALVITKFLQRTALQSCSLLYKNSCPGPRDLNFTSASLMKTVKGSPGHHGSSHVSLPCLKTRPSMLTPRAS